MRLFIFTPCRTSFALLVILTWSVHPEHLSDVRVGDIPRPVTTTPQPQGRLIE